ncbi:hypothetical protein IMZ48_09085 [Candidatus Bathyarchaeota archaeon]|nr:hypothetical protein [Candidatus Bathyarchaeota archaeon]
MSVIDPVGNVILGDPLKTWESWPVENPGEDRDDSAYFLRTFVYHCLSEF